MTVHLGRTSGPCWASTSPRPLSQNGTYWRTSWTTSTSGSFSCGSGSSRGYEPVVVGRRAPQIGQFLAPAHDRPTIHNRKSAPERARISVPATESPAAEVGHDKEDGQHPKFRPAAPRAYRLGFHLRNLGADDRLITECLDIDPDSVATLLDIGARKLARVQRPDSGYAW